MCKYNDFWGFYRLFHQRSAKYVIKSSKNSVLVKKHNFSVTILKNVVTFEGDKLYLFTLFIW